MPMFEKEPAEFLPQHVPLEPLTMPASGEAHIWFLDLTELARPLRGALDGHLQADDPTPFKPGQLRFARRFYLRLLLGAYLGIPGKEVQVNRSVRGKPVLDATVHTEDLHFSMAKSNDRLLVGFATSWHLGVDLETVGRRAGDALGVARRYFSAAEYAALAALPSDRLDAAFLRAWACKEAVVKASGHGIANQLCRFTVEIDPERRPAVLEFDGGPGGEWSLSLLHPDESFMGAVAAPTSRLLLQAWHLLPSNLVAND
jgi:4'-phosphopantetheinyl transferase